MVIIEEKDFEMEAEIDYKTGGVRGELVIPIVEFIEYYIGEIVIKHKVGVS